LSSRFTLERCHWWHGRPPGDDGGADDDAARQVAKDDVSRQREVAPSMLKHTPLLKAA
jgi:hypothetical protein